MFSMGSGAEWRRLGLCWEFWFGRLWLERGEWLDQSGNTGKRNGGQSFESGCVKPRYFKPRFFKPGCFKSGYDESEWVGKWNIESGHDAGK
jgi:hypothetical protein